MFKFVASLFKNNASEAHYAMSKQLAASYHHQLLNYLVDVDFKARSPFGGFDFTYSHVVESHYGLATIRSWHDEKGMIVFFKVN